MIKKIMLKEKFLLLNTKLVISAKIKGGVIKTPPLKN